MRHPTRPNGSEHLRLLQCGHCHRRYHRDVAGACSILQVGILQFVARKMYLFGKAVRDMLSGRSSGKKAKTT